MDYTIQLQTLAAPRPLAVVRRRARIPELPRVVPEACGLVWNYLRSHQIKGAGRNVAVYLDDEMNIEVGVEMDGPFAGGGELVASHLPPGRVATAVHMGPYQRLAEAHRAIRDWCAKHGHAPAGPNWELYGHWQEAWKNDASQIRTDVYYLLAPGAKPTQ